jgi:phosphoglycerol transferase MdoB-like AlkP superfamily enzyme
MKKNALFYLVILFVLLNICDLITTLFTLPGESNPIYLLTNSLITIVVLKILIIVAVCWMFYHNKFKNTQWYFLFISVLVYGTLALFLAQLINISAINHPVVIKQASEATVTQKVSGYATFMGVIYLFPIIFSYICFLIYDLTFKDVEFMKKKRKKKWK